MRVEDPTPTPPHAHHPAHARQPGLGPHPSPTCTPSPSPHAPRNPFAGVPTGRSLIPPKVRCPACCIGHCGHCRGQCCTCDHRNRKAGY